MYDLIYKSFGVIHPQIRLPWWMKTVEVVVEVEVVVVVVVVQYYSKEQN
jgi:hypothetical protein